MYCNGVENMVVHGMHGRAVTPLRMVTWKYCNGVENMIVHGMQKDALTKPQVMVIYMYSDGVEKLYKFIFTVWSLFATSWLFGV